MSWVKLQIGSVLASNCIYYFSSATFIHKGVNEREVGYGICSTYKKQNKLFIQNLFYVGLYKTVDILMVQRNVSLTVVSVNFTPQVDLKFSERKELQLA